MPMKLQEIKTQDLTVRQLQDVVIALIKLHNGLAEHIQQLKTSNRIATPQQARENAVYGI